MLQDCRGRDQRAHAVFDTRDLEAVAFVRHSASSRAAPRNVHFLAGSSACARAVAIALCAAAFATAAFLYHRKHEGRVLQATSVAEAALGAAEAKVHEIAPASDNAEAKLEAGAAAMAARWFDTSGDSSSAKGLASFPPRSGRSHVGGQSSHKSSVQTEDLGVDGESHGWYRVYINTIVREGEALNSSQVTVAPAGIFVHAEEVRGRRVRVDEAATSLEHPVRVAGWVSMQTADGQIQILRPARSSMIRGAARNSSMASRIFHNAHALAERKRLEETAVRVAQMTAYQKMIDDNLHKVNPKGLAHDLTSFGRNREKYEEQGVNTAQKAGEHVGKTLERAAGTVFKGLDTAASKVAGQSHVGEKAIKELKLQLPEGEVSKGIGQAIMGFLKNNLG